MKFFCLPIFISLSLSMIGCTVSAQQNNELVPTQTEIVKNGIWHYFKNLPQTAPDKFLADMNMDNFNLFLRDPEIGHLAKISRHQSNESPFALIWGANEPKRFPKNENSFPFINASYDMADVIKSEFGFCAGFTVTLRQFNMLSYFDDQDIYKTYPPNLVINSQAWFLFYKNLIDQIMRGEPVIIPHFKNLLEFSSHPQIGKYIKQTIVQAWVETNINVTTAWRLMRGTQRTFSAQKAQALLKYINFTLSLHYNPIVYASGKGATMWSSDQWIHVLQVYATHVQGDEVDLFVWDINYKGDENVSEPKKLTMNLKTGLVSFQPGVGITHVLAEIGPLPYDQYRIGKMMESAIPFCKKYQAQVMVGNQQKFLSICRSEQVAMRPQTFKRL